MVKILAVFAHPDDEGAISGTLAHYARLGVQVSLICATSGEAGEISDPSLATPENLGVVREEELRCACETIGISELHMLGYCDSGMEGTAENRKTTAFIQADPDQVYGKLVGLIRQIRPQVMITFEPFGWYGHPDHKAVSRHATEALHLAGDPGAYPDRGAPWQPDRLFHSVMPTSRFQPVLEYAEKHGIDFFGTDGSILEETAGLEKQITHALDVDAYYEIKLAATACHRTQFGEDHLFLQLPADLRREINRCECFIQVHPPLSPQSPPYDDLLAGLPDWTK